MNYVAIALASVAEFIVGAIWYMPLFGKQWGDIHGFNDLTKSQQKAMQAKMGPFYGLQLLVTVITTVVLAKTILVLPDYSPYMLALMAWVGFVVPTQVSAVVFGGTKPQFIAKKILIMSLGSLACLMVAAAIINAIQ
jgi:hypothetical protein